MFFSVKQIQGLRKSKSLLCISRLFFTVMGAALNDFKSIISYTVNQTILVVYPPAPKTRELSFERFGLPDSVITVSVDIL